MKKTFQIHLRIENDVVESLRKEAESNNISLAELCRQRLREDSQLNRIEKIVTGMSKKME